MTNMAYGFRETPGIFLLKILKVETKFYTAS